MPITVPTHSLVFGSLNLLGKASDPEDWWIEAGGEGADFGNAEPIEKTILSFLIDGSIDTYESFGNRELTLPLVLCATTSAGLAAAEAALMAEVSKANQVGINNTLVWTPPEQSPTVAAPCVFDVARAWPTFAFNDLQELQYRRGYNLTLSALPFVRSQVATTVTNAAPTGSAPTTALLDNCNATTGWSIGGTSGTTTSLTADGASIRGKVTNTLGTARQIQVNLARTFSSVNMSATPYIRIEMGTGAWRNTGPIFPEVSINGVVLDGPAAQSGSVVWYQMPFGATTLTTLVIKAFTQVEAATTANLTLRLDDIQRSSAYYDASGSRQRSFNLPVKGSARTQGSLSIIDPTVALGSVLVYAATAGETPLAQPNLRTRRTAGSTETTDTSLVSGKYSDLATNHVFQIPAVNLDRGGYVLYARIKHTSAADYTLTWAAKSVMGTTTVDASQSGTQKVTLAANTWTVVPVAAMPLPTAQMGPNGIVQVELSSTSGVLLDEAWLFNLDTGRLVHVECGTGTPAAGGPANRAYIVAAALSSPTPKVLIGTADEQADAYNPGVSVRSFGQPVIVPPSMSVFVVTSNSIAADVTLEYFARYFSHVGT